VHKAISEGTDAKDFEPKPWHNLYFSAFDALRFDRHFGAMGGEGPISYLAISQYCRDHQISGDNLFLFRSLFSAIDAEWLKIVSERQEPSAADQAPETVI